jgi:hypothetical protein
MIRMLCIMSGLFTVLSAAVPTNLQAQPPGGGDRQRSPEQMAKAQTARMREDLGLTAEQEKPVLTANLKFAERMVAARREAMAAGGRPDVDSVRTWSRQRDEAFRTILTAEQYDRMQRQREDMRRQNPGGGRRGGGGRR